METKKSANGVRKRSVLSASRFIGDHAVCAICPKFVACRSDQHQGGPGTVGFALAACLPRPQHVKRCHSKGFPVANSLGSRLVGSWNIGAVGRTGPIGRRRICRPGLVQFPKGFCGNGHVGLSDRGGRQRRRARPIDLGPFRPRARDNLRSQQCRHRDRSLSSVQARHSVDEDAGSDRLSIFHCMASCLPRRSRHAKSKGPRFL
jgi:hypothetical protein